MSIAAGLSASPNYRATVRSSHTRRIVEDTHPASPTLRGRVIFGFAQVLWNSIALELGFTPANGDITVGSRRTWIVSVYGQRREAIGLRRVGGVHRINTSQHQTRQNDAKIGRASCRERV